MSSKVWSIGLQKKTQNDSASCSYHLSLQTGWGV